MKKLLTLLCFALVCSAQAQSMRQFLKAAANSLSEKDPQTALFYLGEGYKIDSTGAELCFLYAQAYSAAQSFERAAYWATKAQKRAVKPNPALDLLLADAQLRLGRYELANKGYKLHRSSTDKPIAAQAQLGLQKVDFAQNQVVERPNWSWAHLGKEINSPYSEFSPMIRPDTLLFASLRYDNPTDKHDPPRPLSRMLTSYQGKKATPIGKALNDPTVLTAHMAFSLDEQRMYFTKCSYGEGLKVRCDVWVNIRDAKGRIKKTEKVEVLNDPKASTTQLAIGFDSIAMAERLFLSSDRTSGAGGFDLWTALWDGKKWGKLEQIEFINTSLDEMTPHFHNEKQTLYFSSNGRPGLGGMDIYGSRLSKSGWSEPVNLGKPVNSGYEDMYFVIESCGCNGMLASNRPGSMFIDPSNKTCCFDLYQVGITDHDDPLVPPSKPGQPEVVTTKPTLPVDSIVYVGVPRKPIVPVTEKPDNPTGSTPTGNTPTGNTPTGNISTSSTPPANTTTGITPKVERPTTPTTVQGFSGLRLYFDNDYPNPRSRSRTTSTTYEATYQQYVSAQTDYRGAFADRIALQDSVDYFFAEELNQQYDLLQEFQIMLLLRLIEGDKITISLRGYSSPRAQSDYNDRLADRRIMAVLNQFTVWNDAALAKYLSDGRLVIRTLPYGESRANTGVSDNLTDRRNSVYTPAAARERRVEIEEVVVE
jgi:hypothetical protein